MSVAAALTRVVAGIRSREDDLVDSMITRNLTDVSGLGLATDEPTMLAAYRASARANLRAGLAMLSRHPAAPAPDPLRSRRSGPPVEVPREALAEAQGSARARIPLEALLQTYQIGHAVAWDALIDEVEQVVEDSRDRRDLLRLCNQQTFAYVDAVLRAVVTEYRAESRRGSRRPTQQRLDAVLALLDGTTTDTAGLGYEVTGWNLGLVAWGGGATAAIAMIAERLQRPVLCVRWQGATAWGWLGGRRPLGRSEITGVDGLPLPEDTAVALGSELPGLEGFRRTHRQAREAQHIGTALGGQVTHYPDVAVEALALRDPDAARAFVDQVLGPLRSFRGGEKLQQTLSTYLRCGLNAASAAALLGISDRTVAYRLRLIEDLTGHPLARRRFELEAAVRLERVIARRG